jgi:Flp pilus assembly protein TadG
MRSPSVRNSRRRGNAIIELAFAVPLLVAMFLGTWNFGYAYFTYGALEQAVRSGARYASVQHNPYISDPTAQVRNVVVYGTPTGGATSNLPGLATGNVSVAFNGTTALGTPATVTVSITGYALSTPFGNVTLQNKPSVQMPYVGLPTL